jgi:hypothetical protein
MLSPANERLSLAYRRLYDFSKEIGRCLSQASPDAVALGVRNAMFLLSQQELPAHDEVAVALCGSDYEKLSAANSPKAAVAAAS